MAQMTKEELAEEITKALNRDADLTKEEYEAKCAAADQCTAKHGIEGEAPVDEELRHKRVQTNFYGTAINMLYNLTSIEEDQRALLVDIRAMLGAALGIGEPAEVKNE